MKNWLLFALGLTVLAVAASLYVYANREALLPEKVPTHWNASFEPDKFTPRDGILVHLLLVPGLMVGMIGLAYLLPWLSPVHFKVEPFQSTYEYIMGLVIFLFGYMHAIFLFGYMERLQHDGLNRWLMGGMMLILAVLGNVLGKVKRNFWVGIRTPWTLASDTVWIRTHRLGAWLFVLGGVLGFLLVMAGVNAFIALGVFGVCAIVPVFYSLVLYKKLEREGKLEGQAQPR